MRGSRHLRRSSYLATLLLAVITASFAHAGTFTAYGPKTFLRGSGKPVIETDSFNIKNPNTTYTLKIYNGGTNSEYTKVSSAIIKLNGSTIFDISDFNQQVSLLQKQVSASKSNDLSVELRSSPGSGLTIIIEGEDSDPPSVAITSPANDTYTNIPSATVNGTTSDATSWINNVTINGTGITLSGETFSASINLIEGTNTITATATDAGGNTGSANTTIYLDTIPPAITLDPLPSLTNNPHLTITGKVEDMSPIVSLMVNGTAVNLSNNSFATVISLIEGDNQITLAATDKARNTTTTSVSIFLDTIPPTLTITSPSNNTYLNTPAITATGTAGDSNPLFAKEGAGGVTITVNGINAAISENNYSTSIQLKEGPNTLTITATDKAGNTSSSSVTVTLDTAAPVLIITSPANGSTLDTATATVTGSIDDNTATVTVNGINATVSNNTFTASSITLTEGANTIAVTAIDQAGNTTTSYIIITYISKPAPIITITSPADGSTTDSSSIQVTGTIDDPTATVTINGNPAMISNCDSTPRPREPGPSRGGDTCTGGPFFSGYVNLTAGENTIIVTATNLGGRTATTAIKLIKAPSITITSPVMYSTVATNTITIIGTIDDSTATIKAQYYDFNTNQWTDKWTATITSNNFEIRDIELSEAWNTIRITATDTIGNRTERWFTVFLDTIPPKIRIIYPVEGFTYTRWDKIYISGSLDGYSIVKINDEAYGCPTCRYNHFDKDVPLNEGANTITVTATDPAGNTGIKTVVVYLDTTPPVVTITSPASGSTVMTGTITVTGTIDEKYLDSLYVYNGTTQTKTPISDITSITNGSFTISGVQLTNGLNYIAAVAIDKAGNISYMSIPITYQLNTDTTPPYISLTSPTKTTSVNTSTITVTGYIDDNTATVKVNGINATVANNKFILYDFPLIEGLNTITVKATDPAGNTTTYTFTITYDITPPTVTSTNPAFNATDVPLDSAITVTFSEKMSSNTITDSTFTLSSETGSVIGTITYGTNSATFMPSSNLRRSTVYTATIKGGSSGARDAAGNALQTDYAWVFKTAALPVEIYITEPSDGATVNKSTILIKGTIKAQTQDVGVIVNGLIAEMNGENWSAIVPLQTGTNTIEATATDSSGNTDTQTININTESTSQAVTITTNPQSGIAPLSTTFTIDTSISNTVTFYKIDFDGDGVTDMDTTSADNISHTYETTGIYYPTVTVTDSQNITYFEATMINVLSKEEMDALLKGKWTSMIDDLSSGDTTSALSQISSDSQNAYQTMFAVLGEQLPSITATAREFILISISDNRAKYKLRTVENGKNYSYEVIFVKDEQGLWKIKEF